MKVLYIFLVVLAILSIITIYYSISLKKRIKSYESVELKSLLNLLIQYSKDIDSNIKEEFATNRIESGQSLRDLREETANRLDNFTRTFSENLTSLTKTVEEKLIAFKFSIENSSLESRKELKESLSLFKQEMNDAFKEYKNNIRDNFSDFNSQQQTQNVANTEKLSELKKTLETSIRNLQDGNEKKLDEMRIVVDEKLQKTLESRLSQSFELVSKNLESVQKGLGEMQQLANGVGDLKKVLSNVKSRGILGEIQLGAILEEILSPGQYKANVQTKKGSREFVEFAICLPGRDEEGKVCFLPIDAKFPVEDYYSLANALEVGDLTALEISRKRVDSVIKKCAKDIRDKYLDPPNTTDFGIMFLPFEGLYAEVVRKTSLIEILQREYRIIITGPSTLAALLSSLRLGFNTLAIEKQSSEITKTLQAIKTEFITFEGVLKKAQEKILGASGEIDRLVGTRTRMINSKLKKFTEISGVEAKQILETNNELEIDQEI